MRCRRSSSTRLLSSESSTPPPLRDNRTRHGGGRIKMEEVLLWGESEGVDQLLREKKSRINNKDMEI